MHFNPQRFLVNCCKACPLWYKLLAEYDRLCCFTRPYFFSEKVM